MEVAIERRGHLLLCCVSVRTDGAITTEFAKRIGTSMNNGHQAMILDIEHVSHMATRVFARSW